jgi:hypothetical protein
MATIENFETYLKEDDVAALTELIQAKALDEKQIQACIVKEMAAYLVKDEAEKQFRLIVTLLENYDLNIIAKQAADILGKAIYATRTADALFIINELTPLLGANDWMDSPQYPPLITAVHFNNVPVIRALAPKLTREQLEQTSDTGQTALGFAIVGRKTEAVKAICQRGLQLTIESTDKQNIKDIAGKIVRQIAGESVFLTAKEHATAQKSLLNTYYDSYLGSCTRDGDFNALRQLFFNTFKYLDDNNKRGGLFKNIFGNKKLSTAITRTANEMKAQITAIDSRDLTPMANLLRIVTAHIVAVREHRDNYATVHHHESYGRDPLMREGWSINYDSKKPYANGEFEKNIVIALNAIKQHIFNPALTANVDNMIRDINDYKPEQKVFNNNSYCP